MTPTRQQAGRGAAAMLVAILVAISLGVIGGVLWGRLSHQPPPPPPSRGVEVPPPAPGPEKLVLSEERLTELLKSAAGDQVQDPKLSLTPGKIVATGGVKRGNVTIPMEVTLVPQVRHGAVVVGVRTVKVGGMILPREASSALSDYLQKLLDAELAKLKGLVVDTVDVNEKQLVITGHFAPEPTGS
jgi:hypothetical protein